MPQSSKKRLVFCTYSSIYSSLVLKKLLADDVIEVAAIINSTRVIKPQYGFIKGALAQIQLSGWRYASYLFMVTDLFSWLSPSKTIHGLAKKNAIPVFNTHDINTAEVVRYIESKQPDYLLAAHFNQLIKKPLLKLKCINIHPSLLPEYKGVDPVFYALLDQQNTVGVTLHKMAETFDTGEILSQKKLASSDITDNVFSNNCHLFSMGADLAIAYLSSTLANNTKMKKSPSKTLKEVSVTNGVTDGEDKHYDSWPSRAKITEFRRLGKRLIRLQQYWQELRNV